MCYVKILAAHMKRLRVLNETPHYTKLKSFAKVTHEDVCHLTSLSLSLSLYIYIYIYIGFYLALLKQMCYVKILVAHMKQLWALNEMPHCTKSKSFAKVTHEDVCHLTYIYMCVCVCVCVCVCAFNL
jgi:hypothetical protein